MLGKLFKYEFRHTAKTMFLTYAALGLFTLMASAALYRMNRGLDSDKTFFTVLSTTMLILYIIAIIAIYCVDFIYLIYQYYKTKNYKGKSLAPYKDREICGSKGTSFYKNEAYDNK